MTTMQDENPVTIALPGSVHSLLDIINSIGRPHMKFSTPHTIKFTARRMSHPLSQTISTSSHGVSESEVSISGVNHVLLAIPAMTELQTVLPTSLRLHLAI